MIVKLKKMGSFCGLMILILSANAFADEKTLTGLSILDKMKDIIEPAYTTVRMVKINVYRENEKVGSWQAYEARKRFNDGKRVLLVITEPDSIKGFTFLIYDKPNDKSMGWIYSPFLGRTKKIVPVISQEHFLGTDFTYKDLGFVDRLGSHQILGKEAVDGVDAYKIDTTLQNESWYSHIITWISVDHHLPLKRSYYDLNDNLWKTQSFKDVHLDKDTFVSKKIMMTDLQENSATEYELLKIVNGVEIPDDIFNPNKLDHVLESSFWEKVFLSENENP